MNNVALVMSLNKRFDRKVIEGVTRFIRESADWSVFVEDDPQAKIPNFLHGNFDGVIADLDDPVIPKRLVGLGIPVVGVGGVMGPEDARAKLDAGATLVQLYTGLVYEGPGLVKRILKGLG